MPEIRVLNVAEKPSVARSLAGVFSHMQGSRDRPQRREAAQIFEIEHVRFPRIFSQGHGVPIHNGGGPVEGHCMITTSVRGHLASQDFGPQYGWSKCDPIQLFDAPIETYYRDDMEPLKRMLSGLARNVQAVILWLDCDREGEAIADEVREVCLQSNPRIQSKIFRAKFSTVLPAEIQRALKSLGRVNEAFVQAVQLRSELDLRVGAAFTRFQTLRLQKKFAGFADQGVVSYGGCQFPTLGFVVERWARIETFREEQFWSIELKIRVPVPETNDNNNNNNMQGNPTTTNAPPAGGGPMRQISFTWKRGRLYDHLSTLILFESCLDVGEATVTNLRGTRKQKWRPVPLSTVELQKRASRYLRIGSETLMTAAEELYNAGYISYPRTETEVFRREFQHRPLIQEIAGNGGEFREYASKLLAGNNHYQNPRRGRNDDNAHPPITPCKAVDPNTITDVTQRNIYKLIVKHYLACCSKDAVGQETNLTVRIGTEEFTAKGLMVLERNWLEVYHPWERWSTGQGELPELQIGSRITPSSLTMNEGRTTPPLPISEVELISLMDRHGIGTDATIAQHITTIQERQYAFKDANQRFSPSPLGIALVEGYNSMGYQLNKPDLRREMEAECNHVASGRKAKDDVMGPLLEKMRTCYNTARTEANKLDEAIGRRFSRIGAGNNENFQVVTRHFSYCGSCNLQMALKREQGGNNNNRNNNNNNNNTNNNNGGRRNMIVYCDSCRQGWRLPPRGVMLAKTQGDNGGPPVNCPICSYQVIEVKRGEGYDGNGYHFCPKCFSDPPTEHGGSAEGRDFRCFDCTHQNCALASGTRGGEVEAFPCPFCSQTRQSTGSVKLRKNSRGFVLSCSNYSAANRCQYTIWLPKEVSTIEVDANSCPNCSTNGKTVKQIKVIWKLGSVPPAFDRETVVCVLCDGNFRQHSGVSLPRLNQVTTNNNNNWRRGGGGGRGQQARGGQGGRGRGGGGRGRWQQGRGGQRGAGGATGNGGNRCFVCQQEGHYANACPNRR